MKNHDPLSFAAGEKQEARNPAVSPVLPLSGLSIYWFPFGKGIERLVELGVVKERTGGRRNRVFAYNRYLVLSNEGTEPL